MPQNHSIKIAKKHLSDNDPKLAKIIKLGSFPNIMPTDNYYGSLLDSIISQQLSVSAASSIENRLKSYFNSQEFPSPEQITNTPEEELRLIGLSRQKISYIKDLAQHILNGSLDFDPLINLPNDEIIKELTAIKGIGPWTAHMFLIFSLGRLDILPTGDLGIKNAVTKLYKLPKLASPSDIISIAEKYNWHPYESVASWYLWESLNNKPKIN